MRMRFILQALGFALMGCGGAHSSAPGEIVGTVQIVEGMPSENCLVLVEGSSLGGPCDAKGNFSIRKVPAGRWTLRIHSDERLSKVLPTMTMTGAVMVGVRVHVEQCGAARVGDRSQRRAVAPLGNVHDALEHSHQGTSAGRG